MADFCQDCVRELWGDMYEPGGECYGQTIPSDIPGYMWALCEGCGEHYFDGNGRRICRAPQPHDDAVPFEPCWGCCATFVRMVDRYAALVDQEIRIANGLPT